LLIFSGSLAILLSFFSSNILLPLLIIFILSLYYFYGQKAVLGTIIITYLAIPSDFFGELRVYLNILATCLLFFLFIKEFGFQFWNYPKIPKEILLFLVGLFISLIVSTVFSSEPKTGFFTIITMLTFFIICYIFYSFLKDEQNIYIYFYSIFAAVLILSIRMFLDLYQLGFQDYLMRSVLKENIKLYSSVVYTGTVMFFVSITLLTAMFLINNSKKKILKYLLSFLFIFNVIILILANSRGLIIAALLSISFILLVLKRSLFFKILFSIIVVSITLFFSIPVIEDTVNLYLRTGTTHREIFWEAGLDIIKDHPIVGVGPHQFDKYFYTYAPSNIFAFQEWKAGKHTPHNFFLYYTAENGVLGFLTGVSLFVLFFYIAIRTMKLSEKNNKQYFILSTAITGMGIGFFIRSFFEVTGFLYYGYITTDLTFWLIFGILISINQRFNVNHKIY